MKARLIVSLLIPGLIWLAPATARAAAGMCMGRTATIIGTSGNDELVGTSASDVIIGRTGNDLVRGLGGNDYICLGRGKDQARGGEGDDPVRVKRQGQALGRHGRRPSMGRPFG
jgi:RTX calcium-binding nonapeptide repeat (4 copies)